MTEAPSPSSPADPASGPPRPPRRAGSSRPPWWRPILTVLGTAGSLFTRYRVAGLAAEVAFFAVLSLPPLVFGLTGAIGFVADAFDVETVQAFRDGMIDFLSRFLTDVSIEGVVAPTLDSVLNEGRIDVISIGFVLALWSGSRTIVVLMDTITIMYGQSGHRGLLKSWSMSFAMYLMLIVLGAVVVPAVLVGPTIIQEMSPVGGPPTAFWFWVVVPLGAIALLTSVFNLCVPLRRKWTADIPGAILTLVIWFAGSRLLKWVLAVALNSPTLYGPLAAPIAILMWLYITSLAILLGAGFNAALEKQWPDWSGLSSEEADGILETDRYSNPETGPGSSPTAD